jgi:hypothetical protein
MHCRVVRAVWDELRRSARLGNGEVGVPKDGDLASPTFALRAENG